MKTKGLQILIPDTHKRVPCFFVDLPVVYWPRKTWSFFCLKKKKKHVSGWQNAVGCPQNTKRDLQAKRFGLQRSVAPDRRSLGHCSSQLLRVKIRWTPPPYLYVYIYTHTYIYVIHIYTYNIHSLVGFHPLSIPLSQK